MAFDAERGVDTVHDHAGQPVATLSRRAARGQGLLFHDGVRQERRAGALAYGQSPPAAPRDAMPLATFTSLIERELRKR